MFNPDYPFNDLPKLPALINYDSVKILKALTWAKAAIGRLDVYTKFLPDKEMFLTHFAIKESVESSLIESIDTDVETIYEASRIEEKYMNKDQKEVMYYKDALILWAQLVKKQWFLAQNDYVKIWNILSQERGQIRTWGLVNIKRNHTEVLYTPPAWKDNIERLLANLENYFNNMIEHDIDSLIKMALVHYQFEAIHPFYDWNWRTWRILMVLHLVLHWNLEYPLIYLSWYINKHRGTYYELLRNVTEKWEWEDYIVFMLKWIESQALKTINDIEKIRELKTHFVKILENDWVIKKVFAEPLSSILISKPKLIREDLSEFWSFNTLTTYLNRLISLWILKESWTIWKFKIYTNVKFIELTK